MAGSDGATLYLDDEGPAPNALDVDAFGAAWSAHRKGRHHTIVVEAAMHDADLPAAIRDAIRTTVAQLTGPVLGNNYADFLDEAASIVDSRIGEAAGLFRESGRQWSRLASLALETVDGLGANADVAEERLALIFSRGQAAEAEICLETVL